HSRSRAPPSSPTRPLPIYAQTPAYARTATRAEAMDATVCSIFYHTLYLGEVHRLARMVAAADVADGVRARLVALAEEGEREPARSGEHTSELQSRAQHVVP